MSVQNQYIFVGIRATRFTDQPQQVNATAEQRANQYVDHLQLPQQPCKCATSMLATSKRARLLGAKSTAPAC